MLGRYTYTIDDIRAGFATNDYIRGQEYARTGFVESIDLGTMTVS